jgi:hypothetical protein
MTQHPSGLTVYGADGKGTGVDLPTSRDPLYQTVRCKLAPGTLARRVSWRRRAALTCQLSWSLSFPCSLP